MSTTQTPETTTWPFDGPVDATPQNCWLAARSNLALAVARGETGGRLLNFRALEFKAWQDATDAALDEERPGTGLLDFPAEDVEFLHADAAGLTPPEAATWLTAGLDR